MNTETFFENFGHLANAPDGVKRLTEMVLQLAARGQLAEQDPDDVPVTPNT